MVGHQMRSRDLLQQWLACLFIGFLHSFQLMLETTFRLCWTATWLRISPECSTPMITWVTQAQLRRLASQSLSSNLWTRVHDKLCPFCHFPSQSSKENIVVQFTRSIWYFALISGPSPEKIHRCILKQNLDVKDEWNAKKAWFCSQIEASLAMLDLGMLPSWSPPMLTRLFLVFCPQAGGCHSGPKIRPMD